MKSTIVPILIFVAFSCPTSADDTPDASLTDLHGDPLPKHAIGRLGTVRFLTQEATVSNLAWSPGRRMAGTWLRSPLCSSERWILDCGSGRQNRSRRGTGQSRPPKDPCDGLVA